MAHVTKPNVLARLSEGISGESYQNAVILAFGLVIFYPPDARGPQRSGCAFEWRRRKLDLAFYLALFAPGGQRRWTAPYSTRAHADGGK